MWISKKTYNEMLRVMATTAEDNDKLIKINKSLCKKIKILENDKSILLNLINPDIPEYPNTEERGQGDSDTPDNLSDLFSNF